MKPFPRARIGFSISVMLVLGVAWSLLVMSSNTLAADTAWVAKAKKDMPQWTPVRDPLQDFEPVEIDKKDVPKGAIDGRLFVPKFLEDSPTLKEEANKLKNRQLLKDLRQGDILTHEVLQPLERAATSGVLPPGNRAFSIKTNLETAVASFILPGSRVDIIHVMKDKDGKDEAKIIMQNILVRAVEQQIVRPEDKVSLTPVTITLEVTPEQTVVLTKAVASGTIRFTLRPFGEDRIENDKKDVPPPPPEIIPRRK